MYLTKHQSGNTAKIIYESENVFQHIKYCPRLCSLHRPRHLKPIYISKCFRKSFKKNRYVDEIRPSLNYSCNLTSRISYPHHEPPRTIDAKNLNNNNSDYLNNSYPLNINEVSKPFPFWEFVKRQQIITITTDKVCLLIKIFGEQCITQINKNIVFSLWFCLKLGYLWLDICVIFYVISNYASVSLTLCSKLFIP